MREFVLPVLVMVVVFEAKFEQLTGHEASDVQLFLGVALMVAMWRLIEMLREFFATVRGDSQT